MIQVSSNTFSNHDALKIEVNYKHKWRNDINTCILNNSRLNNQWLRKEIEEEIKRFQYTVENEDVKYQNL